MYYSAFASQASKNSREYRRTLYEYCEANNIAVKSFSFFSHVYSFANSILDKLVALSGGQDKYQINSDDMTVYEKLKSSEGGAIFISAHFGNIELARAKGMRKFGKKFSALVYTDNAEKYNSFVKSLKSDTSTNLISVKNFNPGIALEIGDRLDKGEWVFIMGDRSPVGSKNATIDMSILGRKAQLPMGPFLLAFLYDVPVYSIFCFKQGNEVRLKVEDLSPDIAPKKSNRDAYINEVASSYCSNLNTVIPKAPEQWFNFFNFWG